MDRYSDYFLNFANINNIALNNPVYFHIIGDTLEDKSLETGLLGECIIILLYTAQIPCLRGCVVLYYPTASYKSDFLHRLANRM